MPSPGVPPLPISSLSFLSPPWRARETEGRSLLGSACQENSRFGETSQTALSLSLRISVVVAALLPIYANLVQGGGGGQEEKRDGEDGEEAACVSIKIQFSRSVVVAPRHLLLLCKVGWRQMSRVVWGVREGGGEATRGTSPSHQSAVLVV